MNLEKTEYTNVGMTTKERQVYNQIKEAILNNEFKPGTVLVERRLSEIYNVSRSPVRYALRQLAKEGLLTDEPGKGIIVPVYTLEDILEVYDLLEVLQVYAIQVSLKNYDMITDATLGQIMEQMRKANEEKDLIKRMDWDVKFHEFMIHHVSNKRLDMIFELLVNQKRRFDLTSFNDEEHGHQTTAQHEKIYEAILARDVDKCVDAIKAHLQYIKQYYINKLVTGRYNL
ncbi:MAG: GntR family transcriptional regulator [Agathobacter sp.]